MRWVYRCTCRNLFLGLYMVSSHSEEVLYGGFVSAEAVFGEHDEFTDGFVAVPEESLDVLSLLLIEVPEDEVKSTSEGFAVLREAACVEGGACEEGHPGAATSPELVGRDCTVPVSFLDPASVLPLPAGGGRRSPSSPWVSPAAPTLARPASWMLILQGTFRGFSS